MISVKTNNRMTYYEPKDIQRLLGVSRDRLFSWVRSSFLKPAIPSKRPRSKAQYSLRNLAWIAILSELEATSFLSTSYGTNFPNVSFKFSAAKNAAIKRMLSEGKSLIGIFIADRAFFETKGFLIFSFFRTESESGGPGDDTEAIKLENELKYGPKRIETHLAPNDYLNTISKRWLNPPANKTSARYSFLALNVLGIIHKVERITGETLE